MSKQLKYMACALVVGLLLTTVASWAATSLTGAGATFPYPIYSKWFDAYGKSTGARINYQSIGSGAGIQQLKARTVDFGASDAPLSNEEIKSMPGPVIHIPTVAGAVVVIYNVRGVGNGLRLTPQIVSGIFLGKIKSWDDSAIKKANPKMRLPRQGIFVAHRSDGSGTSYIFTNYLAAVSSEWKSKVGAGKSVNWPVGIGGKGNEGVAGIVKQTPGTVGYVELAYAVQNHLPYASVQNRAGQFVAPGIESTTIAASGAVPAMKKDIRALAVNSPVKGAYPISGFTYILLYRNQVNGPEGKELCRFLNWAMHDGQKMARSLLYAPLPESLVRMNTAALAGVKFAGKR
jgi:phosphate transport system substrate-binding protein